MITAARLSTMALAMALAIGSPAAAADLRVRVEGVANTTGEVLVAVYVDPAVWLDPAGAINGARTPATIGAVSLTVRDLAPGIYGVVVLHDENLNEEMDYTLLGLPGEGYAFANSPSTLFGPPAFEDAVVVVRDEGADVVVRMTY